MEFEFDDLTFLSCLSGLPDSYTVKVNTLTKKIVMFNVPSILRNEFASLVCGSVIFTPTNSTGEFYMWVEFKFNKQTTSAEIFKATQVLKNILQKYHSTL